MAEVSLLFVFDLFFFLYFFFYSNILAENGHNEKKKKEKQNIENKNEKKGVFSTYSFSLYGKLASGRFLNFFFKFFVAAVVVAVVGDGYCKQDV